jgi:hypothetical protein
LYIELNPRFLPSSSILATYDVSKMQIGDNLNLIKKKTKKYEAISMCCGQAFFPIFCMSL